MSHLTLESSMDLSTDPKDIRPSRLWRGMDGEQRVAAADAFWRDDELAVEQAQAIGVIAKQINFRARSVAALPIAKKARHLAAQTSLPEALVGRILITYHLTARRQMMGAFLDRLGIGHDNGLITDEQVKVHDETALAAAAQGLATEFPPRDVALYLGTLLAQDPETWGGLSNVPELEPATAAR